MKRLGSYLQKLDWRLLAVLAVAAALAPWPFGPEPHLVEKARWLVGGYLNKPLDIFDVVFHASPSLLLLARFAAVQASKRGAS